MEKKRQKVECFVTANVPHVYADKDGIERVVLNILSNPFAFNIAIDSSKLFFILATTENNLSVFVNFFAM